MNVVDVFDHFERLGTPARVVVYVADRDPVTCRTGFGAGMNAAQRQILRNRQPMLVLGLESRNTLLDRDGQFKAFLDLPCVQYLELPFAKPEFDQAVESLRGSTVSALDLSGVRRSVTWYGIESIRISVTHRLKGGVWEALRRLIEAIDQVLKGGDCKTKGERIVRDLAIPLESYRDRFAESLTFLEQEIEKLDGISPREVLKILKSHSRQLRKAEAGLARLATGIASWIGGESEPDSLVELAKVAVRVKGALTAAGDAFRSLANYRTGA